MRVARPGARVGDISAAIEDVGRAHGCGIVRPFVGHGMMCLAIEPMFTLGSGDVYVEADGWTVATSDDVLAAHFEHTIAITATGPEILTKV